MTPWELQEILQERLGEQESRPIIILLDEVLIGQAIYWPKRFRRQMRDGSILALRGQPGMNNRKIALRVGVSLRTVERVVKAYLEQRKAA